MFAGQFSVVLSFAKCIKAGAEPFLYFDAYEDSASLILRRAPTAKASFAAIRAQSRFGIAIAAIIRMDGITAIPKYPSTRAATAIPCPVKRPADFRMSEIEICPKMIAALPQRCRLGPVEGRRTYCKSGCYLHLRLQLRNSSRTPSHLQAIPAGESVAPLVIVSPQNVNEFRLFRLPKVGREETMCLK